MLLIMIIALLVGLIDAVRQSGSFKYHLTSGHVISVAHTDGTGSGSTRSRGVTVSAP